MNGYMQSILVIVVVCHVFSLLTPTTGSIRRTYRFLCGLAVLAVIALPIHDVVQGITQMLESLPYTEENDRTDEIFADKKRLASTVEEAALGWMRYISVVYGIPMENMEMTVREADGNISEIWLYVDGITELARKQLETELCTRMEAKVSVWEMAEK